MQEYSVALCAIAQLIHLWVPEAHCFPPTLVIGKKDKLRFRDLSDPGDLRQKVTVSKLKSSLHLIR